jgi:hypothetical protein
MSEQSSSFSIEQRFLIRDAIEREMWAKGWNRKKLVGETELHQDTINNALNKNNPDFSDKTLFLFEKVLGKSFRQVQENSTEDSVAPDALGAYSRKKVARFFGEYVCVRPYFADPKKLNAYVIELAWSDAERCMTFQEKERPDPTFTQRGHVYMPDGLPYMSLMTIGNGEVRHIILCKPLNPNEGYVLRGLIQTLHKNSGVMYMPVSAPIVLFKPEGKRPQLGAIEEENPDYKIYRTLLDETSKDFVRQV